MTQYQLLPQLSEDEYAALRESIRADGVKVPIELDERGAVLDGHHRLAICKELGITDYPRVVRVGLSEEQKIAHVLTLNLDRRHLSREQRREVIATVLRAQVELCAATCAACAEDYERLADDIVMIDRGRVIARGDTTRLKRQVAADHVHVVLADPHEDADPDALSRAAAAVERTVGTDVVVDRESHSLVAPAPSGVTTVIEVARALDDAGIALAEISLRQPTLDDVFLTLTGRPPGAADPTNEESPDR